MTHPLTTPSHNTPSHKILHHTPPDTPSSHLSFPSFTWITPITGIAAAGATKSQPPSPSKNLPPPKLVVTLKALSAKTTAKTTTTSKLSPDMVLTLRSRLSEIRQVTSPPPLSNPYILPPSLCLFALNDPPAPAPTYLPSSV